MEFGKILNELREERFIPKRDLANAVHISRQQIKAYEDGDSVPNIETLLALADYFEVSADYLLGRDNYVALPVTAKKRYIPIPEEFSDYELNLAKGFIKLLRQQHISQ